MSDALPPDVAVQITPTGLLYELPPRETGWLRQVAWMVLCFGLGLVVLGVLLILVPTGLLDWVIDRWSQNTPAKPFDPSKLFDAFYALPCLIFGFPLLKFGRFLMGGRSVIELRGDKLITIQGSGLMRRQKKFDLSRIKKLQVKTGRPGEVPSVLSNMAGALNVVLRDGGVKNLAWGYRQDLLLALASDLSIQCEQAAGAVLYDGEHQSIWIEQRTLGDDLLKLQSDDVAETEYDIPPRPDDAVANLEHHADGLTITVPAVGIRKGAKGMFGFSIVWNLFMMVFTVGAIAGGAMTDPDAWVFWIVVPVFWVVGVWIAVAAINAGKRRAILDVVGDTLLITRQSIFKTQQDEVRRDDIASIRRDKSGTEVNDVPILNLQVHRKQGKKIALLSQLSDDELAWIAGELRKALGIER